MLEYPCIDLDLLRTYALKIDRWSLDMVNAMKCAVRSYTGILLCDMNWNGYKVVYYIEHDQMKCRSLDIWVKDRTAITWDEFVEMSSPHEDFSEQLAALLGI